MVGVMGIKKIINNTIYERCLLTEISPYETPLMWSNWGMYNYYHSLEDEKKRIPKILIKIIGEKITPTIPYNYMSCKDITKRRVLTIPHPNCSSNLIELYRDYSLMMIKLCQKSSFSIHKPYAVAKYYFIKGNANPSQKDINTLNENDKHASHFFAYYKYSHLFRFFESTAFTRLERKYQFLSRIDIRNCFPSIYTHTINWAIYGKDNAKSRAFKKNEYKKSFGSLIDNFFQKINDNETFGIIIGPEISRIFAEIILQAIDRDIKNALMEKGYEFNNHYFCARYIDDYYFFYSDKNLYTTFVDIVTRKVNKYKFVLNESKFLHYNKPFINTISIKKINFSNYIQDMYDDIISDKFRFNSRSVLNKIRELLKNNEEDNHVVISFFISTINNKLRELQRRGKVIGKKHDISEETLLNIIDIFIEIVFYLIRIDIRVNTIYKLAKFIVCVSNIICGISNNQNYKIKDKLFYESVELLKYASETGLIIESMNILIALCEFQDDFLLSDKDIFNIISKCKQCNSDEETKKDRLSYFEIISILFYIKDEPKYTESHDILTEQIEKIFKSNSPVNYSESCHLLLDIMSCPYYDKNKKQEFTDLAIRHFFNTASNQNKGEHNQKINHFVNFCENKSWFCNWQAKNNISVLIEKKEYASTYS